MRKSTLLFLVFLLIGYFYAIPVLAQGTDVSEITTLNAVIPDFQVNENTGPNGESQFAPAIAADGIGNYIMTWEDSRNGDQDIYAQRYSSDGTEVGSNFKVNDDSESADQRWPSIAADGSGNFIITWGDDRNGDLGDYADIYAQRYSSDGTAVGSNFKVNDDGDSSRQFCSSIAAGPSGNFIITWQDDRSEYRYDIYAQQYSSDGIALGSNFKVNDDIESGIIQHDPSIATDGSGNFIIAWTFYLNDDFDIYAQRYASDGTAEGSNFKVNDDADSSRQFYSSIAAGPSGNFIITWKDDRNGEYRYDIYAQRYSSDGTEVGSNFKVNDDNTVIGELNSPSVAADGSGNFIITWQDDRKGDDDIYAQRYASDGVAEGSNFKVSDDTEFVDSPSIAADDRGNFIITWQDHRKGDDDIYAQRYASDGTAVGNNFKANDDTESASQNDSAIAADGSGNFIITWADERNGDYRCEIFAQRYLSNGTAVGSNFRVSRNTETAHRPSIATDGSGKFIITWHDSNVNERIYAQRYASDGTPMGSNFKVNDTEGASLRDPSIAIDGSGNFIVTWSTWRPYGNPLWWDVYAQRYLSDGTAVGGNFKVNDDALSANQRFPFITADGSGNFIIAWTDRRNGRSDIYAQQYSSDGTAEGSNFKVNDDADSSRQFYSSIAAGPSGNYIITWQDGRNDGSGYDIYAQLYSSDGTAIGSNFKVNDAESASNPSTAADGSGNYIITWDDTRTGASYLYAQRYASDGTAMGGNFRLTNTSDNIQISPDVKLWNNRIYTTWTDNRGGGTGYDIWANVLEWDNPVGIRDHEPQQIPSAYRLHQNYPNPFNPSTTIRYSVAQPDFVRLAVYDELGKLVRTLLNERKADGEYSIIWDGKNEKGVLVSSGTYFYTLKLREKTIIAKRMLLLR